jgi:hypothetical protein
MNPGSSHARNLLSSRLQSLERSTRRTSSFNTADARETKINDWNLDESRLLSDRRSLDAADELVQRFAVRAR